MDLDNTGILILLVAGLTALSMFFSLNTLAMRNITKIKLRDAFRSTGKEDRLDAFLERSEAMSLACGFFRLLCNSGIIFTLVHLLADHHYIISFLVSAAVIEVFTLLIPHSWSKHAGEYILPRTYPILLIFMAMFRPILWAMELHDRLVRRFVGAPTATSDEQKEEQLLSAVEQSKIEGVVDEEEMDMIENVLELDETTAEQIMTPRTDLIALPVDSNLNTTVKILAEHGLSRIPIYDGSIDNILGILYTKDLLTELGSKSDTINLRQKMRKAYFVPESKPLRDLLREFKTQKLHIAVVLDEYGGTAGIVTIEDILEQLVGDIDDEYDKTEPEEFRKISDTIADVDARMYIDNVNSELEIQLPEDEDYDTLGGFIFSHLGYIPKTGETFDYKELRLTIVTAEARSIRRVRIEKLSDDANKTS
jgi:CBS domain containing-hemolysin-like protein